MTELCGVVIGLQRWLLRLTRVNKGRTPTSGTVYDNVVSAADSVFLCNNNEINFQRNLISKLQPRVCVPYFNVSTFINRILRRKPFFTLSEYFNMKLQPYIHYMPCHTFCCLYLLFITYSTIDYNGDIIYSFWLRLRICDPVDYDIKLS